MADEDAREAERRWRDGYSDEAAGQLLHVLEREGFRVDRRMLEILARHERVSRLFWSGTNPLSEREWLCAPVRDEEVLAVLGLEPEPGRRRRCSSVHNQLRCQQGMHHFGIHSFDGIGWQVGDQP